MNDCFDDPELIDPVIVHIEQLDTDETQFDDGPAGTGDILNVEERVEITLQAQVAFGNLEQKPRFSKLGKDEDIKGYILIKSKEVSDKGIELKYGDKITKITNLEGTRVTEYKDEKSLYLSHSNGDPTAQTSGMGFTLVRMFFHDRQKKG